MTIGGYMLMHENGQPFYGFFGNVTVYDSQAAAEQAAKGLQHAVPAGLGRLLVAPVEIRRVADTGVFDPEAQTRRGD